MKMHVLQHVPFEGPAYMSTWAIGRGHDMSITRLFLGEAFPALNAFDWLIVMGGPMSVHDDDRYPWLKREKAFIREAVGAHKIVLGVCLGAQLIAESLGGSVFPNRFKEIGFYPVRLTEEGKASDVFSVLPGEFDAFHWHGDTFDLPPGCTCAASSEACANQAFVSGDHVYGLQFHLEAICASVELLLENCADELIAGPYIQPENIIITAMDSLDLLNTSMGRFLDAIESQYTGNL